MCPETLQNMECIIQLSAWRVGMLFSDNLVISVEKELAVVKDRLGLDRYIPGCPLEVEPADWTSYHDLCPEFQDLKPYCQNGVFRVVCDLET
jgi:hypothetical protein